MVQAAFLRLEGIGDVELGEQLVLLNQGGRDVAIQTAVMLEPAVDPEANIEFVFAGRIDMDVCRAIGDRMFEQIESSIVFGDWCDLRFGRLIRSRVFSENVRIDGPELAL